MPKRSITNIIITITTTTIIVLYRYHSVICTRTGTESKLRVEVETRGVLSRQTRWQEDTPVMAIREESGVRQVAVVALLVYPVLEV